jgi:1-aminocyclopropane-1-carboxylate deaminase
VEKWVPWDDAVNDKVGNILLSRMMGADVRLDPSGFDIGIRRSWEVAARGRGGRRQPYPIPAGSTVGFTSTALNLAPGQAATREVSTGRHRGD